MAGMIGLMIYPSMRVCPACGKTFEFYCSEEEWGYAYGKRLTCSYHCMRQMEREDKRKPRIDHPAAMLYRRIMLGKKCRDLVQSMIARKNRLRSADEIRAFVDDWTEANPREAQRIRDEAAIQLTHLRQSDVAGMAGVDNTTVRKYADINGITGKRIAGCVYYTAQEADRIIAALGVTA